MSLRYRSVHIEHDATLIGHEEALAEFQRDDATREPLRTGDGRGTVWRADGRYGPAVMKAYRRGGLLGKLVRQDYLWTGEAACRSLAEFRMTSRLVTQGLRVPRPIAAFADRRGPFYRARILTQRIEHTGSLLDRLRSQADAVPWQQIGRDIARLHKVGAQHADLNATNILLDATGSAWIIDWDKGMLHDGPGAWVHTVLARLLRGLLKHRGQVPVSQIEAGFQQLKQAHDEALKA